MLHLQQLLCQLLVQSVDLPSLLLSRHLTSSILLLLLPRLRMSGGKAIPDRAYSCREFGQLFWSFDRVEPFQEIYTTVSGSSYQQARAFLGDDEYIIEYYKRPDRKAWYQDSCFIKKVCPQEKASSSPSPSSAAPLPSSPSAACPSTEKTSAPSQEKSKTIDESRWDWISGRDPYDLSLPMNQ